MPATEPEHSAWERLVLGLYGDEVVKWLGEVDCRGKVRAANVEAARRAR